MPVPPPRHRASNRHFDSSFPSGGNTHLSWPLVHLSLPRVVCCTWTDYRPVKKGCEDRVASRRVRACRPVQRDDERATEQDRSPERSDVEDRGPCGSGRSPGMASPRLVAQTARMSGCRIRAGQLEDEPQELTLEHGEEQVTTFVTVHGARAEPIHSRSTCGRVATGRSRPLRTVPRARRVRGMVVVTCIVALQAAWTCKGYLRRGAFPFRNRRASIGVNGHETCLLRELPRTPRSVVSRTCADRPGA